MRTRKIFYIRSKIVVRIGNSPCSIRIKPFSIRIYEIPCMTLSACPADNINCRNTCRIKHRFIQIWITSAHSHFLRKHIIRSKSDICIIWSCIPYVFCNPIINKSCFFIIFRLSFYDLIVNKCFDLLCLCIVHRSQRLIPCFKIIFITILKQIQRSLIILQVFLVFLLCL